MASNDRNNSNAPPEEALLALARAAQVGQRQQADGKRLSVNLPTSPTQTSASKTMQPGNNNNNNSNNPGLSPAPSDVSAALTLLESSMDSMTKFQLQHSARRSTAGSSDAGVTGNEAQNPTHPLRVASSALQQSQTSVITLGSSMESLVTSADEDDGADAGESGEEPSSAGGAAQKKRKRFRRRYYEIERVYKCNWSGCTKAYGTLNHLNHHINLQKHGPKRKPAEFAELRQIMKAQKLLKKAGIDSNLVPQVLQGQATASLQVQQGQAQQQQHQQMSQQPQMQQHLQQQQSMMQQHPSLSRQSSLSGSMMGMMINQQQQQQQFQQKPSINTGGYGMPQRHQQVPPSIPGGLQRRMSGSQSAVLPMGSHHHHYSFGAGGPPGMMDPLLSSSFNSAPGSLSADRRESFRASAPSIKIQTMLPPGLDHLQRQHQQQAHEHVNLPALALPRPTQQSQQPNSGNNEESKLPSIDRLLH